MSNQPDQLPEWATEDVSDPETGAPNVLEPSQSRKERGWDRKEFPPRQFWNWFGRGVSQWIKHFREILNTRTSDPEPETLMKRDDNGRSKVADPEDEKDAANRGWVEEQIDDLDPETNGVKMKVFSSIATRNWQPIESSTLDSSTGGLSTIIWVDELEKFVATGDDGEAATSPDGYEWEVHSLPGSEGTNAIEWSPDLDLLVVVGSNGAIYTSSDGESWDDQTLSEDDTVSDVAWSPKLGKFAAVRNMGNNRVITSSDGETWNEQTSANESTRWFGIAWSEELEIFVAVGSDEAENIMTSTDGENWNAHEAPNEYDWRNIVYSPDLQRFVVTSAFGGDNGADDIVIVSDDGVNWTSHAAINDNGWRNMSWSPEFKIFVAVSQTGPGLPIMASRDGEEWFPAEAPDDGSTGGRPSLNAVTWSKKFSKFLTVQTSSDVDYQALRSL